MEHTKTATVVTTRTHTFTFRPTDLLALVPKKLRGMALPYGSFEVRATDRVTLVDENDGDRIVLTIVEQVTR